MSEEGDGVLSEHSLARENGVFTDDDLGRLLGYERFEVQELAAIPDGEMTEVETSIAVEVAKHSARVKHRMFNEDFVDQVFPGRYDYLPKLVFICDESVHQGKTMEITFIRYYLDEESGLIELHKGMALTAFYQETILLNDKPMKMSVMRARSMGFNFPEGLRAHSTFKCECLSSPVEIKTERLNSLLKQIIENGERRGFIHNGELRFSLRDLTILISSG